MMMYDPNSPHRHLRSMEDYLRWEELQRMLAKQKADRRRKYGRHSTGALNRMIADAVARDTR